MKSIIMSDESVNAIIAGRKWQTRRVVESVNPRYRVGDVLYVKEAWAWCKKNDGHYLYRAEGDGFGTCHVDGYRWKSPIFMPERAARLHIEIIINVRCERVQDISEEDARAEGVEPWHADNPLIEAHNRPGGSCRNGFREAWDRINAKRGYPWASNPWVWVYQFKVVEVTA